MLIGLITGDVRFDHLVKIVSARFLFCKVFDFSSSKYQVSEGTGALLLYTYPV